jgi:hypothetical protein
MLELVVVNGWVWFKVVENLSFLNLTNVNHTLNG